MVRSILGIAVVCLAASAALAGSYEDCVLSGMKGVTSNLAALAVQQACKNKDDEVRKAKQETFGTSMREGEYEWANNSLSKEGEGYLSQMLRNKSQNKVITYFSLEIREGDYYEQDNLAWQYERSTMYYYKLALKPNDTVRLLYPIPRTENKYFSMVRTVLGRESKWSDSMSPSAWMSSGKVKPEAKDPLE
jgi:hypothetical protein